VELAERGAARSEVLRGHEDFEVSIINEAEKEFRACPFMTSNA
jgi:hypothetical protein